MHRKLILVLILILFPAASVKYSQNINPGIVSFFEALIHNSSNLASYVDSTELAKSNRLGINYDNVKNKFLISYDIPPDLKQKIVEGAYPYKLNNTGEENGFTKISFAVEKLNYTKEFYFKK
jgi:hypothetical protein